MRPEAGGELDHETADHPGRTCHEHNGALAHRRRISRRVGGTHLSTAAAQVIASATNARTSAESSSARVIATSSERGAPVTGR